MKAPCCLLGAAALPRPPEDTRSSHRRRWARRSSHISYTSLLSVWWLIVVMITSASAAGGTQCPVRTDALDIESRAYVSAQVVEAVVKGIVVGGSDDDDVSDSLGGVDGVGIVPGEPYTVTVSVSRVLRRYRGPSRVKKRATLTLTFRYPSLESDNTESGFDSDNNDGECLVSANLRRNRKYLLFLSGGGDSKSGSSLWPVPVAPPELANKKVRRLVRKMVCKKCGGAPTVTVLNDDSVVRGYNLTLECTAQGNPAPTVHWYKDEILLTSSRNIKIRTRKRRRKIVLRGGRGTRSPRHSPNPFLSEGFGRRRRRMKRRRRGGGGGGGPGAGDTETGDGGGRAAGTPTAKKRQIRGGRRHEASERRRITGRRRLRGGEYEEGAGRGGGGGLRRGVIGRRLGGKRRNSDGDNPKSNRRSGNSSGSKTTGTINRKDSANSSHTSSRSSSRRSSSHNSRRQHSGGSRRNKVIISSLMVREVREEDAAVYKCVAKSVAGEATSEARIRVVPPIDPLPFVDKCPYSGYCLNGGTCMMFKIVGELVCQCADGFKGQRCEEKEVYLTFPRNCHGPLRHIRHSTGLRCPRNQPTALWELLQQSLARRKKVLPWAKTHLLNWSPTHTVNAYWPHFIPSAPHPSIVPQYVAQQNGVPGHSQSHPTVSTLLQKVPSLEFLQMHQATQDPMLLDSLIPDLGNSQVLQQNVHLKTPIKIPSSPVLQQQDQTEPKRTANQMSTFTTPLEVKVRPDTLQNGQRNRIIGFPPTQPYDYREVALVQPNYHNSQRTHRHHHQHHTLHNTDPPSNDKFEETYTTESMRMAWDQKVMTEVKLTWSPSTDTTTTPHFLTTPNHDNLQQ